ncbi:hypothetical protein pb186bvf_014639 [Paramecium bursaria]
MFQDQKFQEFLQREKTFYSEIQQRLDSHITSSEFTYESIYSLFSHISILQNTQTKVIQMLMKMFGSLIQDKQVQEELPPKRSEFFDPFISQSSRSQNQEVVEPFSNYQSKQKVQKFARLQYSKSKSKPKQFQFQSSMSHSFQQINQQKTHSFQQINQERVQLSRDESFCPECIKFIDGMNLNQLQLEKWKKTCTRHRGNKIYQEKLLMTPES